MKRFKLNSIEVDFPEPSCIRIGKDQNWVAVERYAKFIATLIYSHALILITRRHNVWFFEKCEMKIKTRVNEMKSLGITIHIFYNLRFHIMQIRKHFLTCEIWNIWVWAFFFRITVKDALSVQVWKMPLGPTIEIATPPWKTFSDEINLLRQFLDLTNNFDNLTETYLIF